MISESEKEFDPYLTMSSFNELITEEEKRKIKKEKLVPKK